MHNKSGMEWLNFRHLYAFWMVCKHNGFKHAADAMFISQSAVSDHVSQLEGYFEQKLLERNNRVLKTTPAGASLLSYADSIFHQSRSINQVFKARQDAGAPIVLRVGIVGGISRNFVSRKLAIILGLLPTLKIEVVSGAYEELITMIKAFDLEVVLSNEPPGKREAGQLEQHLIGKSPLCIAGNPKLIKALVSKTSTDKTFPFFLFDHYSGNERIEELLSRKFMGKIQGRLLSDDISLLRFFANSGKGMSVLPQAGIQDDIDKGIVVHIPLPELPPTSFYACFLRTGFYRDMINSLFYTEELSSAARTKTPVRKRKTSNSGAT